MLNSRPHIQSLKILFGKDKNLINSKNCSRPDLELMSNLHCSVKNSNSRSIAFNFFMSFTFVKNLDIKRVRRNRKKIDFGFKFKWSNSVFFTYSAYFTYPYLGNLARHAK